MFENNVINFYVGCYTKTSVTLAKYRNISLHYDLDLSKDNESVLSGFL